MPGAACGAVRAFSPSHFQATPWRHPGADRRHMGGQLPKPRQRSSAQCGFAEETLPALSHCAKQRRLARATRLAAHIPGPYAISSWSPTTPVPWRSTACPLDYADTASCGFFAVPELRAHFRAFVMVEGLTFFRTATRSSRTTSPPSRCTTTACQHTGPRTPRACAS
ncbi:hypothetical protein FA95DRAFT_507453 [Auriscalpium vulgare]|uniref:Uncharacterized protein n=1 Tax=Auriscalpium vulgare TaxID=40419 RepID=A0ACB8RGB1_9AGAM|nr:hypothetical protein FA95DRAFT_507453 [Auriscalpium vulgare]